MQFARLLCTANTAAVRRGAFRNGMRVSTVQRGGQGWAGLGTTPTQAWQNVGAVYREMHRIRRTVDRLPPVRTVCRIKVAPGEGPLWSVERGELIIIQRVSLFGIVAVEPVG